MLKMPLDMTELNDLDRFHIVMDTVDRVPQTGGRRGRERRSDMNQALPTAHFVRHADTAWTLTGQHTGRTNLPLTEQGERQARALGRSLTALRIDRILSSPLRCARRTAKMAAARSRRGGR